MGGPGGPLTFIVMKKEFRRRTEYNPPKKRKISDNLPEQVSCISKPIFIGKKYKWKLNAIKSLLFTF